MASRRPLPSQVALLFCLAGLGCASAPAEPAASPAGAASPESSGPGAAAASSLPNEPSAPPTAPPVASEPTVSVRDDREPDPKHALPEVSLRHVGMHIGGESNSPESKKPFLRALEARTTELLLCYRWTDQPLSGGTFGADLFVPLGGGAPTVRAMRHKLGGKEFESCMEKALLSARFEPPQRATVLSYSLRFDVKR